MFSEQQLAERERFKVIGKRHSRADQIEKVMGGAVFGYDFKLPGSLQGKILWSRYPHAKLLKIDPSKAEALKGVRAIVSSKDAPNVKFGGIVVDQTIFATDRTIYVGQPIAAVAADDVETAEEAISLIEVEYEELPHAANVNEAMKESSLLIHPNQKPLAEPPYPVRNISSYTRIRRGDVEKAFERSDLVYEDTYHTQRAHQSYIEPRVATALYEASGKVRVWTPTQAPFIVRSWLAQELNIPPSRITVTGLQVGGGFGGKIYTFLEPICALLSKKSSKPVRIMMSRQEEFLVGTSRPSISYWIKSGVTRDGRIIARKGKAVVDTGAYGTEGAVSSSVASLQIIGPYDIENVDAEALSVYTNNPPTIAFRAPGTIETAFALESHLDMLADKLGIDAVEFRLANAWDVGSIGPTGQIIHNAGVKEAIRQAAEKIEWGKTKLERNQGIGLACGYTMSVGIHSSAAMIKLNDDGTFTVVTGAADIGTGAVSSLRLIAAEELATPIEKVNLSSGDTDVVPWDGGAQGSRTTYGAGAAVLRAAQELKKEILRVAANYLGISDPNNLELTGDAVTIKGENRRASLAELATYSYYKFGGPLVGHGQFVLDFPSYDKESIYGYICVPSIHDPACVAHAALVEVDTETGRVEINRYVAAHDVGRAINPEGIEGQIQGGAVQGIGYALTEELVFDELGNVMNNNFAYYKLPTSLDVPIIEPVIVEGYFGHGPYGAKGVGEADIVPPAPAIANAIYRATGVRIRSLPLTPEKLLIGLQTGETIAPAESLQSQRTSDGSSNANA